MEPVFSQPLQKGQHEIKRVDVALKMNLNLKVLTD